MGCCFQNLLKIVSRIIVQFPSSFFSMLFVSVHLVYPYNSIDAATARKKSSFILSGTSDFPMIDNLSIAVHACARRMLTLLSVGEILLLRDVNLSTNFGGLPLRIEMAPRLNILCVYVETNASCCLLLAMHMVFSLGRCICKKREIILEIIITNSIKNKIVLKK